ncbi:MAG: hypothetical protein ACRDVM_07070 [Acidimicrobiia bacterium]
MRVAYLPLIEEQPAHRALADRAVAEAVAGRVPASVVARPAGGGVVSRTLEIAGLNLAGAV